MNVELYVKDSRSRGTGQAETSHLVSISDKDERLVVIDEISDSRMFANGWNRLQKLQMASRRGVWYEYLPFCLLSILPVAL